MRRIAVIGRSGGGKSTLARRLGAKLGYPVVHLDVLYWQPGWTPSETEDFRHRLGEALSGDTWISDGNYNNKGRLHFERADTIIWVDQPRRVCLRRVLIRAVLGWGRTRANMADGCPERLETEFLAYIWNWDRATRLEIEATIAGINPAPNVVRLNSDAEIAAFLASA